VFIEPLKKDQLKIYETLSVALLACMFFSVFLMFITAVVGMFLFGPDARADEIFVLKKPPPLEKLAAGVQLAVHVLSEMELPELVKVLSEFLSCDLATIDEAMRVLQAYGVAEAGRDNHGAGGPSSQLDDGEEIKEVKSELSAAVSLSENATEQEEIYV
jgi:hypothetical protein